MVNIIKQGDDLEEIVHDVPVKKRSRPEEEEEELMDEKVNSFI